MFNKIKNSVVNAVMGAPDALLQLSAALCLLAAIVWAVNKGKPGAGDTVKHYASGGLL